jgi:hypothetical protein
MLDVRKKWLQPGWEQDIKLTILASSQGNMPINDWINLLESTNTLIKGHACKLTDSDLCNYIQSHVHTNTMTAATDTKLHELTSHEIYKTSLKVIDDAHIRADELLKATIKQMMMPAFTANKHNNNHSTSSPTAPTTSSSTAINTVNSCASKRVPPLTPAEHSLLAAHEGCFQSRRFYANHISVNCNTGFPDKSTYVTQPLQ